MKVADIHYPDYRIQQSYNIYRLALAMLLMIYLLIPLPWGQYEATPLLLYGSIAYALFSLLTALLHAMTTQPRSNTQYAVLLLTDILTLTLIAHAASELINGIAMLLLVPVAAGGLLLRQRRMAVLLAAIGSIALLYAELYLFLQGLSEQQQIGQTGILGMLLFATALALHALAERGRHTAALARSQQRLQNRQFRLASLGRLTASIAHEVRNPIAAISHAAQLLQESASLSTGDRRLTDIVVKQSQRVSDIIQDILDLSRAEARAQETFVLQDWLQNFSSKYTASQAPAATISIDVLPADLRVRFVPGHLDQVLGNLLDNALRHSERHSGLATAQLVARPLRGQHDSSASLRIMDQGAGVPASELDALFEPFHTTEENGVGLGLYLSRQLCEANDARLTYDSIPGTDGCFVLYFGQLEQDSNHGSNGPHR